MFVLCVVTVLESYYMQNDFKFHTRRAGVGIILSTARQHNAVRTLKVFSYSGIVTAFDALSMITVGLQKNGYGI